MKVEDKVLEWSLFTLLGYEGPRERCLRKRNQKSVRVQIRRKRNACLPLWLESELGLGIGTDRYRGVRIELGGG